MATYRSTSRTWGNGSANLTSTITLSKPAGAVDDDYVLAVLELSYGTSALAVTGVPSGWALLFSAVNVGEGGGGFTSVYVYGKKMAGDPANWSWTLNNQVAFYTCDAICFSGVNTSTPYEQLSGTSLGNQPSGTAISRTADTTGINETLVTIFVQRASGNSPRWSEDVGTEVFDDQNGGGNIALNTLDLVSPTHQTVTGTISTTTATQSGIVAFQLAFSPVAVSATVVPPPMVATASRTAPTPVQGVAAVSAAATASRTAPTTSGAQIVPVVAAAATASRVPPSSASSRVAIQMLPELSGDLELVEDP